MSSSLESQLLESQSSDMSRLTDGKQRKIMSNKKSRNQVKVAAIGGHESLESVARPAVVAARQATNSGWLVYLKRHYWAIGIIAFLALGTLGGSLKYLESSAKDEIARRASNQGNLNNN